VFIAVADPIGVALLVRHESPIIVISRLLTSLALSGRLGREDDDSTTSIFADQDTIHGLSKLVSLFAPSGICDEVCHMSVDHS
jgi:hypothetical protein